MTPSLTEQDKDLTGVESTYFIREMYVDPTAVSSNIQAYTSDVVYYIFYGSQSALRALIAGQGLDENTAVAAITSSFDMAKKLLLQTHPTILSSELFVNDVYAGSNALFIHLTISVTTSEGTISVKKEIELGRSYI